MWAFKRRLARLTTTLSFTTAKNDSYWRLGIATGDAPPCPGWSFFDFTPPISKSYEPIFVFFFQKMRRSFLVTYCKVSKNQVISLLDMREKHEGRAESAPPPLPGRGLMMAVPQQSDDIILGKMQLVTRPMKAVSWQRTKLQSPNVF